MTLVPAAHAQGQIFIVQTEHQKNLPPFRPTAVALENRKLTARSHRELIMAFMAEQGFARRAMPLDPHGLVLHANGPLTPTGVDYEAMLSRKGISAQPGDRLIISDIRIEPDKIVFAFNGGPDRKHKFLRHVQIGAGMGTTPVVADDGQEPVGSRLTLVFDKYVPEISADQLRALIQPVMDFSVKTPMEAYADTLPPKIREAILHHQVLVGMNRKMVLYALGAPGNKSRERDSNGNAFEDWIYGQAPETVQFVRFVGDRVVRIETANVGQDLVVRNHDETDGYQDPGQTHEVQMGDVASSTDGAAHRQKPPTLQLPGEQLPGSMQPVATPDQKPDTAPKPIPAPQRSDTGHLTYVAMARPGQPLTLCPRVH